MIDCNLFFEALEQQQLSLYAGVPDSSLKSLCACITDRATPQRHIIAANEGAAIGLATGSYLATGKPGLVYMQNSGLGNAVNPLVSLTDPQVYAIPMVLLIGWRGEPGVHDEPQHKKQGEITLELLDTMDIPHLILPDETEAACEAFEKMLALSLQQNQPVALVARKNTFTPYQLSTEDSEKFQLTREQALKVLLDELGSDCTIVSTTGMASREIFELRENTGQPHDGDFLTVGSMGHCSQIALGIALTKPKQKVVTIDGDGSVLMHMGSLAIIGQSKIKSCFLHIVINNGRHDSVGGQPTVGLNIDLPKIASACGYAHTESVSHPDDIVQALELAGSSAGASLIEIKVRGGARSNLGRPTTSPVENKEAFIKNLTEAS